ncbi:hypothetical protein TrVE_jg5294 [Triparma verrucosa]|uniref:Protein-glucosylgalactosylhydroxylysine glucosidase n=1 Tax=Triparma verrucosa TaxID=1606542 RepID=A0A9W7FNJ0_9STRA|nr:hypothetical protein TrVE_jg5294 [Triparma verrucosa]
MRSPTTFLLHAGLCVFVGGSGIPADWEEASAHSNFLFTETDAKVEPSLKASVGNGYLSFVVGSDTMYAAGLFNGAAPTTTTTTTAILGDDGTSMRARLPSYTSISLDAEFDVFATGLDLNHGTYSRRSTNQDSSTSIEQKWFCSQSQRHVCVMELSAVSIEDRTLSLVDGSGEWSDDLQILERETDGEFTILAAETAAEEFEGSGTIPVSIVFSTFISSVSLKAGLPSTFHTITAIRTAGDCNGGDNTCENSQEYVDGLSQLALSDAKDALEGLRNGSFFADHTLAFADLFESGVEVTGRTDVSRAVNSSLYYILSAIRADTFYSLSPGGLASNSYNGHTFWDCETWMLPPLTLLRPEVAKSALIYRFNRLTGAKLKAKSYDPPYAGAMFPWESASTGEEVTPAWAATGAREQHISADIGLAVTQYFYATLDMQFMEDHGMTMLEEIATFWLSRVEFDDEGGAHIVDVIPPDEYVDHATDSVYTNAAVAQFFYAASDVFQRLTNGEDAPSAWKSTADALVLPFDEQQNIYLEHADYKGEQIKQADVVLLDYPLGVEMDDEVKKNNLEYYANVTDPGGPAMTWGVHSLGYLGLQMWEEASENFNRSFANTQNSPYLVWQETPTGGATNFLTGAGGFLQTVLNGYLGVRISQNGLRIFPTLIEGSSKVVLRSLNFVGCKIDVVVLEDEVTVRFADDCEIDLFIGIEGDECSPFVSKVSFATPLAGQIFISTTQKIK